MTNTGDMEIRLNGIGASPGICIGKAYLVGHEGVDVLPQYSILADHLQEEVIRFKEAVKKAKDELHAIIDSTPEDLRQHAYILETHLVLLKDKMLYERTLDLIEQEHINAEWALKKIITEVKRMFQKMDDDYLKERSNDIVQVADRIMHNLTGVQSVNIATIDKRVILVAPDLSPAETSQIQLERIMGFITDRGGKASHTGIIARSLEIPAVLGLGDATRRIRNDEIIVVDGNTGTVILHPSDATLIEYEERKSRYEAYQATLARSSHLPAESLDHLRVPVMGNIEMPEEVVSVIDHGGDGIGLYRTEFQFLNRRNFPGEAELFDKYRDVVEVMAPRPVTIRTLDINGDKAVAQGSEAKEFNPVLGLRAIRYCLKKPDLFKIQLRAILRAAAYGNVRLLIPLISSVEEILATKRLLDEVALELVKERQPHNRDVELGIMIEVPSAVIMADVMADEVDFFSIGTNDLIQYALAIDRGNKDVAYLYNPLHPAILRMLSRVSAMARQNNIKVYMCGEMAGDPLYSPVLLGLGIDELSMNPLSIPLVKSMIRQLKASDARYFAEEVLRLTTVEAVAGLLEEIYGVIISRITDPDAAN